MMDFVEARAECLELDGDMVTVQSPEEDAYLTTFVAEEKGAWIGAVRTEGEFACPHMIVSKVKFRLI